MKLTVTTEQFETWGPSYDKPPGAIAVPGLSPFRHRFAGKSWTVVDSDAVYGGPALVFTFDLRDPLLSHIKARGLTELPLCSYLSCGVWGEPQLYVIHPDERRVVLVERNNPSAESHDLEFDRPLPEKPLSLCPMINEDYPTTENTYWQACDRFLGRGDRFIRVAGPPLWLYAASTVTCPCGSAMEYVAALGYESWKGRSLIDDQALFIGEGALYWFLCARCLTMGVTAQST